MTGHFSCKARRQYRRGSNPRRDPVYRGGKFTPRTLRDLQSVALNRRLNWYGDQMWASIALDPLLCLQTGGGGDPGGGDPGGGEGGAGTGGSGSGGAGGGGSAGGGSAGTGNTNVGNQLHALPIVSWRAKGQTGIGLTLYRRTLPPETIRERQARMMDEDGM